MTKLEISYQLPTEIILAAILIIKIEFCLIDEDEL